MIIEFQSNAARAGAIVANEISEKPFGVEIGSCPSAKCVAK